MEQPARTPEVVVLVEGPSDVAALEALGPALGLAVQDDRVRLVPMGGITNIARHLDRNPPGRTPRPLGLCDAGEVRFVQRALEQHGILADDDAALAAAGFFVCDPDLEHELIRALGTDAVLRVLDDRGELARFRTFQGQPAWRGRPEVEQLHRFAGTTSGRKRSLAGDLAAALTPERVPAPLRGLLTAAHDAVGPRAG